MAQQLTADDARQSLAAHVEAKGVEIFYKYGPVIGWTGLQQLLADRVYVRYPCEVVFDAGPLEPGEFAVPVQKGGRPEEGFTMFVHPIFMPQLDLVPALVLYQLVALNYGVFASAHDAETFGAAALGLTRDEYYDQLCEVSDQLGGAGPTDILGRPLEAAPAGGGCGGGCH
ncbi:MAG: hypothetical protein HYX71_06915 [Opitutae bacterium]|nr:hypothetical protein [Opitutae bacterium]